MALTTGSQVLAAGTCVVTISGSFPAPPYQPIVTAGSAKTWLAAPNTKMITP